MPVKKSLLGRLVITELAAVHFCSGWGNLQLWLSVMVLESVGEECCLLVELLATHLTLEKHALAA